MSTARPFHDSLLPPWIRTQRYREVGVIDPGGPTRKLAFTADDRFLVGSMPADRASRLVLTVWECDTGREVGRFRISGEDPHFVCSASEVAVVTKHDFAVFDISRLSPGTLTACTFGRHNMEKPGIPLIDFLITLVGNRPGSSPSWSPDGRRLAVCMTDDVRVHVGRWQIKIRGLDRPSAASFTPDGKFLAVVAHRKPYGKGLFLLDQVDIENGEARIHFASEKPLLKLDDLGRMTFSPDGRRVLIVNQFWARPAFPAKGQRVFLADTATGAPCPLPPIIEQCDEDRPVDLAWQPDGQMGGLLYQGGRRYGCAIDGETLQLRDQMEDCDGTWAEWLNAPMTGTALPRSADGRRFAIRRDNKIVLYEFD